MSILDEATVRPTGRLRESDLRSPVLSLECNQTGEIRPGTDANTEHAMRLVVGVHFWANQAQYQHAYQNARRVLLCRLYKGILGETAELRKAIFDGDAGAALDICDRIDKELGR